jgi:hypothetical protein
MADVPRGGGAFKIRKLPLLALVDGIGKKN